jgi:hypothetical protein
MRPELAKSVAGNEMALDVETVIDGGVGGQETLACSRALETRPNSLSSSHRLMRVFGRIVEAFTIFMAVQETEFA